MEAFIDSSCIEIYILHWLWHYKTFVRDLFWLYICIDAFQSQANPSFERFLRAKMKHWLEMRLTRSIGGDKRAC